MTTMMARRIMIRELHPIRCVNMILRLAFSSAYTLMLNKHKHTYLPYIPTQTQKTGQRLATFWKKEGKPDKAVWVLLQATKPLQLQLQVARLTLVTPPVSTHKMTMPVASAGSAMLMWPTWQTTSVLGVERWQTHTQQIISFSRRATAMRGAREQTGSGMESTV